MVRVFVCVYEYTNSRNIERNEYNILNEMIYTP